MVAPYSEQRSPKIYSSVCVWERVQVWQPQVLVLTIHSPAVLLCSFTRFTSKFTHLPGLLVRPSCVWMSSIVLSWSVLSHLCSGTGFREDIQLLSNAWGHNYFSYTFRLIFSASLKMPGEAEITFPIMTVLDELCFLTLLPAGSGTWLLKYLRDTYDSFCVCLVFMLTSSRNQSLYSFIPQWLN